MPQESNLTEFFYFFDKCQINNFSKERRTIYIGVIEYIKSKDALLIHKLTLYLRNFFFLKF